VHPIRPDLLVLGSASGRARPRWTISATCVRALRRDRRRDIVLPAERTAIHLDMILTQIIRSVLRLPPHFVAGAPGGAAPPQALQSVKEMPNFFAAMQAVNQPLEPVFCGGNQRTLQEREQWASACNFFTFAPASRSATRATRRRSPSWSTPGSRHLGRESPHREESLRRASAA